MKNYILILCMLISVAAMAQKDSVNRKSNQVDTIKQSSSTDTGDFKPVVKQGTLPVRFEVVDGDTIPVFVVDEIFFKKERDPEVQKRYLKLVRNVKKAMPYAKLAALRMQMLEDNLNLLKTKKAKKKYIQATQKAVKEEFMDDLKNLTRTQGIILLKLIHRETGKTTWEIMKGYRGGASALMWEAMAGVYGASTKDTYDPVVDHTIEYIIRSYKLE